MYIYIYIYIYLCIYLEKDNYLYSRTVMIFLQCVKVLNIKKMGRCNNW